MVCETLDFDITKPWFCVMGGAQEIAHRMHEQIEGTIMFNKPVNRVGYMKVHGPDEPCLEVGFQGEDDTKTKKYHAVFNSAPLGAQQHMDLDLLNLNWAPNWLFEIWATALPAKSVFASGRCGGSRIAILMKAALRRKSDLSIRACVYPSYNIDDDRDKPGVLLASYTWSAEAEKIGALIDRGSPNEEEEELKELLFHDLALLHAKSGDRKDYLRLHELIKSNYMDHFAYNWFSDKRQCGAFAYFGCGQFSNMWQWITRSDGNYVIIGEAASAHHAWVVGSLESAVRGVCQFLYKHSKNSAAAHAALMAYNNDDIDLPYGPLPNEYNRTEDIEYTSKNDAGKYSSPRGESAALQVMVETIRQQQQSDQIDANAVEAKQLVDFFPPEVLKTATA